MLIAQTSVVGLGLGAQHEQHFNEQIGQAVAQNPGQLHPVLVGDVVFIHAGFDVGVAVERLLAEYFAIVFNRVKHTAAGKGLDATPLFSEIVGQRLAAAFQVANFGQKFVGVGVFAEQNRIHHAAQVGAAQVFVLLFNHHGACKLFRADQ